MRKAANKYVLSLNCRVVESIPIEIKHDSVVKFLKEIEGEWGLKDEEYPVPKFGTHITAVFPLRGKLGSGIKGHIMYCYRRLIRDHHSSDDRIFIEFNAEKISFNNLINAISKKYIEGFNAYDLNIYPESLIHHEKNIPFEVRSKINYRKDLDFFYPFHYMDEILIKNIFGYGADEIFNRLVQANISAERLKNGVFIKATENIVELDAALEFNKKMEQALRVSLPIINK